MSEARLRTANYLCEQYQNSWGGSEAPKDIAKHPMAIVMSRDDDAWVQGIDTFDDVAGYELSTIGAEYAEWVEGVYDLDTGERLLFRTNHIVKVAVEGNVVGIATDQP
jgi:hypothetical protein